MRISEFIAQAEALKSQYGNLEVATVGVNGSYSVANLLVVRARKTDQGWDQESRDEDILLLY